MAAQRPPVPKFGNWNTGGQDINYTVYFENARKNRVATKPSYQNDAQEKAHLTSGEGRSLPRTKASYPRQNPSNPPHESKSNGVANKMGEPRHNPRTPAHDPRNAGMANGKGNPSHEQRRHEPSPKPSQERSKEDHGYHGRYTSSPGHKHNNVDGRHHNSNMKPWNQGSPGHANYREFHQRAGKSGAGYEQSPQPRHRKSSSVGCVEPIQEGKDSYETVYGTPGKAQMGSASPGNRNYDRAPILPKFGEWNTQKADNFDGYTQIFTKAREEKQQRGIAMSPPRMSPARMHESPYRGHRRPARAYEPTGGCCLFPWARR